MTVLELVPFHAVIVITGNDAEKDKCVEIFFSCGSEMNSIVSYCEIHNLES